MEGILCGGKVKIYTGTKEEVLSQMTSEYKRAAQDKRNRKLAAWHRRKEIEMAEKAERDRREHTRVKFCSGKVNGRIFGC